MFHQGEALKNKLVSKELYLYLYYYNNYYYFLIDEYVRRKKNNRGGFEEGID